MPISHVRVPAKTIRQGLWRGKTQALPVPSIDVKRWSHLLSQAGHRPLTLQEEAEIRAFEQKANSLQPLEAPY